MEYDRIDIKEQESLKELMQKVIDELGKQREVWKNIYDEAKEDLKENLIDIKIDA